MRASIFLLAIILGTPGYADETSSANWRGTDDCADTPTIRLAHGDLVEARAPVKTFVGPGWDIVTSDYKFVAFARCKSEPGVVRFRALGNGDGLIAIYDGTERPPSHLRLIDTGYTR
jgi:hypothetical protein